MSFTPQRLFELLPAVYRVRDGESGARSPGALRGLIEVIAQAVGTLEEDLEQLYDDQFIETCADWVAPYIGDLIGYRTLYDVTDTIGSSRAEVAHTIKYRRRKGTASMLEQLARDVTGWDARVVEFFQLLATTQYMKHVRADNRAWVDVRDSAALARLEGAFDQAAHVLEVRRIQPQRGRYNITNVGIFLWRIRDFTLAGVPATKLTSTASDRRYLFSPLAANAPLFSRARPEETIAHLATRTDVAQPITRRELRDDPASFYPASIEVRFGNVRVPRELIAASDLSDYAGAWAYTAKDRLLIDPQLGRLALPPSLTVDGTVVPMRNPIVSFSYGFSGNLGGGTYERTATFSEPLVATVTPPNTIAAAISDPVTPGAVELQGNARFDETLTINVPANMRFELRAADLCRPIVNLQADLEIRLGNDSVLTLNGLVFLGGAVRVLASSRRGRLRLVHCTLVPGIALNIDGTPAQPGQPSLIVASGEVAVEVTRSVVGPLRVHGDATVEMTDSIIDANDQTAVAYAAGNGVGPGGALDLKSSTVFGKVHTQSLAASNAILAAQLAPGDTWPYPVNAERRQQGCTRFSYVPLEARTPRRYRCQPVSVDDALRLRPQFTSERYGDPAYGQLSNRTAPEIRTGAADESEIGALHFLFAARRETNFAVRLDEYLRFALEAGIVRSS